MEVPSNYGIFFGSLGVLDQGSKSPPLDILGPVTPLRNTISPFQFAFMGLLLRPPLAFGVFNELIMVLGFVDHTVSVRHLILLQLRRTEAQTKKRERHVLKCYLLTKIKIKCYHVNFD